MSDQPPPATTASDTRSLIKASLQKTEDILKELKAERIKERPKVTPFRFPRFTGIPILQHLEALEKSKAAQAMEIEELKKKVAALEGDNVSLKDEIFDLKDDIVDLKDGIFGLKDDNDNLREEIGYLKLEIAAIIDLYARLAMQNRLFH